MNIIQRGKPVDWNSQGGKLLEQCLVLSDKEQIFGIAREILQLQSNTIYLNSFYSGGTIFGYYAATSAINSKLRLFYRPLSLRVTMYGIVGLFLFGVYSFLTDFTQVSFFSHCQSIVDTLLSILFIIRLILIQRLTTTCRISEENSLKLELDFTTNF